MSLAGQKSLRVGHVCTRPADKRLRLKDMTTKK